MDEKVRTKIGDKISDCVNRQSFTDEDMEEICRLFDAKFEEEIDEIIKINELLCEHKLEVRVEMVSKEIEEHFRKTGYKSEEEYNWWQALKKREGIAQDQLSPE